eukprot:CAMPEP_0174292262 /NCGR_PEP_ID=MMETSP0809-20121228/34840_1 /TAXON_ID=73025 ORGANISM="Eutreptiella gymnastica-like, Strain CCMP1594" /NCGR_SAMPLE_ID=MMETSP0809 /ASSEMBLY_ACC=CAM_ASM_000658 /LENGTH=98 /DNA_ID=CAMNT_0015392207 /DNA_START=48 /DNA_END=341 /DNA_ORIENTATION=-
MPTVRQWVLIRGARDRVRFLRLVDFSVRQLRVLVVMLIQALGQGVGRWADEGQEHGLHQNAVEQPEADDEREHAEEHFEDVRIREAERDQRHKRRQAA